MFKVKKIFGVGAACLLIGALLGCNSEQQEQTQVNKGIPASPVRIADISGSTEELIVLGYNPVLTGNTDMGNPAEPVPLIKQALPDVEIAGWFQTDINVEVVAAVEPDLIIAGPTQEKNIEQLEKIAPVLRVPYGFNAFRERFSFIAKALNKEQEMEQWLADYDKQAKEWSELITAATKGETFAVIEGAEKDVRIYSSTGVADMLFNDLSLPKAPNTPEPDAWGGKVTSLEGLSEINPDHIILLTDGENESLQASEIWNRLHAVANGKVYQMTSRQNYNEAFFALGKQAVLEQLAKQILQAN